MLSARAIYLQTGSIANTQLCLLRSSRPTAETHYVLQIEFIAIWKVERHR